MRLLLAIFLFMLVSFECKASSKMVFKADDFGRGSINSWKNFFNVAKKNGVEVSVGLIVGDLRNNEAFSSLLTETLIHHNFDYFHHGRIHDCSSKNTVFSEGSAEKQAQILREDKALIETEFNIKLISFGAPCNKVNEHTGSALEMAKYKKCYFPYKNDFVFSGEKYVRTIDIETAPGRINLKYFFSEFKVGQEKYIFQIHPGLWRKKEFDDFAFMLNFCREDSVCD